MTDLDPSTYAGTRVPEMAAVPGVRQATWWRNVRPGRDDLPRRLPEFGLLGLYEVDSSFRPPPTPAGIAGLHFVRTGRPGQGCLTGAPTTGLSLVLISPGTRRALRPCATGRTSSTSGTSRRPRSPGTR